MTSRTQHYRAAASLLACFLGLMLPLAASDEKPAADGSDTKTAASSPETPVSDIQQLKQMLQEQQRQINELRRELADQKKPDDKSVAATPAVHQSIGDVASASGAVPPAPPVAPPAFNPPPYAVPPPQASASNDGPSPLQFKLGDAYFTPVGFMDMTSVTRSTNPGTGIGTNFGSIPYGNTQAGALSETRLSPQNSRIGMRVDALYHDWKILGYWESDFLGQTAAPVNGGLAVSSNPYVFRMRLYWVDLRKGKFEFLAGQSWSLMTPNRAGISPLPGDVFYSQDMDVNYQVGLTWARNPGYRFVFHPTEKVAFAVALENSEPYVGGGNGGSGAVLPAAISTTNAVSGAVLGGQINNGQSTLSSAALFPDVIAKLAFDPTRRFHFEVVGVEIADKIAYPGANTTFPTSTKVGGGGALNLSFELVKNFRILTNNFISDGGGRYIFGQAPDFIIRANGTPSLVHSASTVTGFEWNIRNTLVYSYYGGVYIGQNLSLDANGTTKIGYGAIASDGQNRAIQEFTLGTNTTLMKDVKWGAINLITQYSYLQRNPWLAAVNAPRDAALNMGFIDIRYTLPGSAPTLGK